MTSISAAEAAGACATQTRAQGSDPHHLLRSVRTTLRHDLQVTRTTRRGEAVYVLFDPVSFRSHRLTIDDYRVVSRIEHHRTLQECFDECVRAGVLELDNEEQFYSFVSQLNTLGLMTGQSLAPKLLYDRFTQSQKLASQGRWLGFLFLTIPLANPDRFLDRTIARMRCFFTAPVVIAWMIGMLLAVSVIVLRWAQFWEPINNILALKNLLFLAVAFVGLKIWHELGHGYACKLLGGRVPEMGCKLIVGMPLAYVDASAAWSFPRRRDRILVMLAGMYFELLLFVPATMVWALWPHTPLGSCAYQIVFMAGIATILFNVNPLMKFDGYFILSDLLSISNLYARANQELKSHLKSRVLGIATRPGFAADARDRAILLSYGVASKLYGWMLAFSIAGFIASRLHVVGLWVAAFHLGSQFWREIQPLYHYLWFNPEAAPVRARAKQVGWTIAIAVPTLVSLCPVFSSQYVSGVVTAAKSTQLRVATPGIIEAIIDPVPKLVAAGQTLIRLRNIDVETHLQTSRLHEDAARRTVHLMSRIDPADEARQLQVVMSEAASRNVAEKASEELVLVAPHAGRLASILPKQRVGTYMRTGEVIANVVQGSAQVRAWLNEEQLATSRLEVGRQVNLRVANAPAETYSGTIRSVAPANQERFEDLSLTCVNEGTIAYDPATGKTVENVFQLLIDVPALDSCQAVQGLSATVRIDRRYESLGYWMFRQTAKFINSISTNSN